MASGDIENPHCRVCKIAFTFKGPEPHILPCLHAACKPCVESEHEVIKCTTCQQLFDKADHTFPSHFILSKSLFQSALKNSPPDIICTNRSDGARAETWCPVCEAFLCATCKEFHKETKATRSHVVQSLHDYMDTENYVNNTYAHCETHPGNSLEVFDSSCGFLVCYKCLRFGHSTCSIEDIDKAFDKMKDSELDNNIKEIISRLDVLTVMEQKAQDLAQKLDENSKILRDEVINTFSDIRETLEVREKKVLQETNQSFQEVKSANTERIKALKAENMRCEAALRFMKRSKEISDPVQALTMKKVIDKRMTACTEPDLKEMDGRESSISLYTQDLSDVKKSIATFVGLMSVYDEDSLRKVISGPTTQEKENKKQQQLQKEVRALRLTLEQIPRLIEQRQSGGKIDLKILAISTIISDRTFESEIKHFKNMPWYLSAIISYVNDTLMLGVFLNPAYEPAEAGGQWSCQVKVSLEIRNCFSQRLSIQRGGSCTISSDNTSCRGFGRIVSLKELQDPLKGFAHNDSVNMSMDVNVTDTSGVLTMEEHMTKVCEETLHKEYLTHEDFNELEFDVGDGRKEDDVSYG